eukprot:TRINITY_DN8230_c0_g1_i1.p1 TRINITY_DN8230_c0_g1~~TRINITY_DN8230_c0_g1_i1.p1  ORF type:complete len:525 (-),score=70.04 TRINITY_DN8230_c0_g1_i1:47-1567(-)
MAGRGPCRYYQQGNSYKDNNCRFLHDEAARGGGQHQCFQSRGSSSTQYRSNGGVRGSNPWDNRHSNKSNWNNWNCQNCNGSNYGKNTRCYRCGKPKPEVTGHRLLEGSDAVFFDFNGRYGQPGMPNLYQGLKTLEFVRYLFADQPTYQPLSLRYPELNIKGLKIVALIDEKSVTAKSESEPSYEVGKRILEISAIRGALSHDVANCFKLETLLLIFFPFDDRTEASSKYKVRNHFVPCDSGLFADHLLKICHTEGLDRAREKFFSVCDDPNNLIKAFAEVERLLGLNADEAQLDEDNLELMFNLSRIAFKIDLLGDERRGAAHTAMSQTEGLVAEYQSFFTDNALVNEETRYEIFKAWKKVSYCGISVLEAESVQVKEEIVQRLLGILDEEGFPENPGNVDAPFTVVPDRGEGTDVKEKKHKWSGLRICYEYDEMLRLLSEHVGQMGFNDTLIERIYFFHNLLRHLKLHQDIKSIADQSRRLNEIKSRHPRLNDLVLRAIETIDQL